jgi:SAM-dependent methyltransferase
MADNSEYFSYLRRRSRLGALYRQYWLYPKLVRRLHGRTLDIGCGIGDMLAFRQDTIGVDINPQTVEFCRARGSDAFLMHPDLLPFVDGEFQSVLLDNVLEHLADPKPLFSEIRRVLSPLGNLLIGVPGLKGWKSDPDHKVHYDESSLVALGQAEGFSHAETFFMPLVRSHWLDANVRQYCIYATFVREA